ncbi:hypothetical protein FNB15_15390 [Ferrovibrio terrae]|uniref:Uncharacterized protein n=1 Tax=Ferrovibrio terrae TaxID=2594003 RepID=A0A516H479_9PROT|nr:hypothetical protein [Ferrovibrio terrae]QDO98579.1 hypothetical protein FNB15_15390 [Ferrovibrio terrae]
MPLHRCFAALTIFLACTGHAAASTPQAWQELFAEAGRQCAAESGLLDAAALAQPIDLGDVVLVLVGGMWPQPHMKQAPAHLLCRYSKANGDTTVIELPADWRTQLR